MVVAIHRLDWKRDGTARMVYETFLDTRKKVGYSYAEALKQEIAHNFSYPRSADVQRFNNEHSDNPIMNTMENEPESRIRNVEHMTHIGVNIPHPGIYDRTTDNLLKMREKNDLAETGEVHRDDNWNGGSRFNNKAIERLIAAREAAGEPAMATQPKWAVPRGIPRPTNHQVRTTEPAQAPTTKQQPSSHPPLVPQAPTKTGRARKTPLRQIPKGRCKMLNLLKRLLILLIVVPLGGIIIGMMAGPWTGLMTMLVTVSGIRWKDRPAEANRDQHLTLPALHTSNPSQPDQAFNLALEDSSSQAPVIEARFQVESTEMREIIIEQAGVQEKDRVLPKTPWSQNPAGFACRGHSQRGRTQTRA